jgi:hypothetical protein
MDLTLLPHLSERALREEAERRGITFEGLARDALVTAIRAHESQVMTVPPAHHPVAYAPTVPPAPPVDDPPSALSSARSLLGKVVGMARSALDRRSEPPPAEAAGPDEPIRTRSLARLLEDQGHLERALSMVRELAAESAGDEELARWAGHLERRVAESVLRARSPRLGVEIVVAAGLRGVLWKIDDAGLGRARALLGGQGELTLRVVRILRGADHSVESRQEDRRPLEPSGWALLDAPPKARLVVSVGLAEGARFVSIAHASA